MHIDEWPLEWQFRLAAAEHKWRLSDEQQRLDMLRSLVQENLVLHSELELQKRRRPPELPPLPKPVPKKPDYRPLLAFQFGRLLCAFFWKS